MKILALGGSGDMGRMAVAALLDFDSISSITVADKDYELAKTFVELVGSNKLLPLKIDVAQKEKLVDLISSHDVVINTTGPFYKLATMILDACIEAKRPYADICDDWKPTLDLLERDQAVKDAGITALIGIGASPGISNLLAVLAYSGFDEVDKLITAWGTGEGGGEFKIGKKPRFYVDEKKLKKKLGPAPEKPNAAIEHLLYETIEKIPTFKNGSMIEIEPLTEAEPIRFPDFNEMYACHIGHPEPVTLPRTLKKAKSICNLMFIGKTATYITRQYSQKIKNKEITIQEATIAIEKDFNKLTEDVLSGKTPELLKEYLGGPPPLCAIATGIKEGKRKKVAIGTSHFPFGEMAGVTGIPLAIGTIMMMESKITAKGALTPEEAFKNPMEFFDIYAKYCGKNLRGKDIILRKEVNL